MNRSECLQAAEVIACQNRESIYGAPEDNFEVTARFWSDYLECHISAGDVANMMILLKIARSSTGKFMVDNYADIAGYAACACEIGSERQAVTPAEPHIKP